MVGASLAAGARGSESFPFRTGHHLQVHSEDSALPSYSGASGSEVGRTPIVYTMSGALFIQPSSVG